MAITFDLGLVQQAWAIATYEVFDIQRLCEEIIQDMGHDKGTLEVFDLMSVANGQITAKMHDLAFGCSSVSALYAANNLHRKRFAHTVFVMLCYRIAVDHGEGDVRFIFHYVALFLIRSRKRCDAEFQMDVLTALLCTLKK